MNQMLLPRIIHTPAAAAAPVRSIGPLAWIDRLAAWADRQPRHHHLGRWTAI